MRFRPRISLRVFLGCCLVIAVALGILRVWVLEPMIRRADAESRLRAAGATIVKGRVTYLPADARFPTRSLVSGVPRDATWLERALSIAARRDVSFHSVTQVDFLVAYRNATDADLGDLLQFPELEKVDLTRCELTLIPGGFRSQNVGSPDCTDLALAMLAKLPRLRTLILGDSRLGDAGCAGLSHSESIELMGFSQSQVTDRGLLCLANLKSLKELSVANNAAITSDGDAKFLHARPGVKFWSNYSRDPANMPDFANW